MRNRITRVDQLIERFPALAEQRGEIAEASRTFPFAITPYYASLIRELSPSDPVYQMSIPDICELYNPPFLNEDPLEEEHDTPTPGLVHRYRDRALLLVTSCCAMYCRHCTRKRIAGKVEKPITAEHLSRAVDYLRNHPEIHDVVISGGDPMTLPTMTLDRILTAVRSVETIDIIRIGTRTPVTLPMRINRELTNMLRRHAPVWINTHFNHPNELVPASIEACARIVDAGIPLGNQTVLLHGVNDDPGVIETLCRRLVKARVRPYYLFQCDLVRGVEHFRTPISRGIEIMEYLRGRLSGFAIPAYVVDAPGGGGKIPVLPNYVISSSPTHTVLRNFEGMIVSYPEPVLQTQWVRPITPQGPLQTIWDLAAGQSACMRPEQSRRALVSEAHEE